MRTLLILATAAALAAGDAAPLPPAIQKLVDGSTETVGKAHDLYLQALKKEQDKLVATLQKEQDKSTKKGDLDAALAIKAEIEQIQGGLLARQAETKTDLLGDPGTPAPAPGTAAAALTTDCAVAPDAGQAANPPKELATVLARCSRIILPKGDHTHYTFACTSPGTVAITTGGSERNNGELWQTLEKAGFKRHEDGAEVWLVLEAKAGAQFTVYDPLNAGMPATIYAQRFVKAH